LSKFEKDQNKRLNDKSIVPISTFKVRPSFNSKIKIITNIAQKNRSFFLFMKMHFIRYTAFIRVSTHSKISGKYSLDISNNDMNQGLSSLFSTILQVSLI
jgi:hypothetical protein